MSVVDSPDDEDVINTTPELPSVFIDERPLNSENRIRNVTANQTTYRINDSVFVINDSQETGVVEFKVYEEKVGDKIRPRMDHDYDMYCSTPTETESENEDDHPDNEPLPTSIQEVPHGIIVNSNVYLTTHQWNTLIFIDVKNVQCAVCDVYIDLDTYTEHVATERHKKNLDAHKPLERFNLSITRMIRNKYHCAVCNDLFDASDNYDHFNTNMHEGNKLFAINKASDIMYDYDIHENNDKIDCYHFNENNINDNRNYNENSTNDNASSYSDFTNNENYINFQNNYFYSDFDNEEVPVNIGTSYATMAKKPKANLQEFLDIDLSNKKVRVRFDSWHMIISPKLNRFYCMVCKKFDHIRLKTEHCSEVDHLKNLDKCKVVEAYEEYFIRQVDDKLYHCGHCNNLQLKHEMEHHVETNHPRKTKISTETSPSPVNLSPSKHVNNANENNNHSPQDQNNGVNTTVKDNDEAIKMPQNKLASPVDNTIQRTTPVIDPQNNGVGSPIKDSDKAVQRPQNTPPPVKYYSKTIQRPIINSSRNANNDNTVTNADNGAKANANSINDMNARNASKLPSVFDDIVIYPFGYKLTIPILSYNIVCKRPHDFYCGLCDMICPDNMISRHLYEIRHIELLLRTPFIVPFGCHLIREIREALHCAICNMPITVVNIYNHIKEAQHLNILCKALGVVTAPVHLPNVKVKPNANVTASTDVKAAVDVNTATANVNVIPNVAREAKNTVNDVNISNDNETTDNTDIIINDKGTAVAEKAVGNDKRDFNDKQRDFNDRRVLRDSAQSTQLDLYEDLNETMESAASEEVMFDMDEYVYLKLRNSFIKISNTSYNTLVHVGDGSRYCFVCAMQVDYLELQKHVDNRSHLDNMEKYRFLDKYEDHLLRQIFLMYHCCICNVIITRKELKTHLEWPTHALQNENTLKNIKKTRKNEIKGGIKQILVSTQKENIYLNEKEPNIKIHFDVEITEKADSRTPQKPHSPIKVLVEAVQDTLKKNKIIILNDNVLKISWEGWHGISKIKNGYKCNLCQRELQTNEIDVHCGGEWHRYALDKPFEKQYAPALIRKINELTLNCVICNTEVSNKDHIVTEHINGKKHIKNYETILQDSSQANAYDDCNSDVLML